MDQSAGVLEAFTSLPWLAMLGWLLAIVSGVSVAPQLFRVIRTRRVDGISTASSALAAATMGCWAVWTAQVNDIPAFASSLGPLTVWAGVLVGILIIRRDPSVIIAVIAAGAVVGLGWRLELCALLAVSGSIVWALPQVRSILRAESAAGVSAAAYLLLGFENIAWIAYALGTRHYAYAIAPLVQAPAGFVIAFCAHKHHRVSA